MAVYKAIPQSFAKIHPRYMTPTVSTVAMGVASIVFYVGLTIISGDVLGDSIASLGLMIAFYYGLTGFACAWYFRRQLNRSARDFVFKGLLPLLGGLMLLAAFIKSAIDMYAADYGDTSFAGVGGVFLLGIGSLLLGVVLMIVWNMIAPPYFRGEVLTRDTPVLVPEGAEHPPGLALPDSMSQQSLVIPPEEADKLQRSEDDPPAR
jgi:amino acid transporter